MGDDEESLNKDSLIGTLVMKTKNSATGSLVESVSSLARGADAAIGVCKRNLDRMGAEQSIANTRNVRLTDGTLSVSMSPAIEGMLQACYYTGTEITR